MRGFTLLEALVVLALAASLLAAAAPTLGTAVDRVAVLSAREALVGLLARTRSEARAGGGSRLVVSLPEGAAAIRVGDRVARGVDLGRRYGVQVTAGRARDSVTLVFDGRGLGRVASRTFVLRRGRAESRLVVSSYGRVRRDAGR